MRPSELSLRMKSYEDSASLPAKTPVIIRLDGKAFHTFTRGFTKPFCDGIHAAMVHTAEVLAREISGVVLAYTQSDEISLLLSDWDQETTLGWYAYKAQKMVSVSASIATLAFNRTLPTETGALFDARVMSMPFEEVVPYFVWRQQDAERNSVSALGQSVFSHKQIHGKSTTELKKMLVESGSPWESVSPWFQRGSCVVTRREMVGEKLRRVVYRDHDIPRFNEDPDYITRYFPQESA